MMVELPQEWRVGEVGENYGVFRSVGFHRLNMGCYHGVLVS